jgi:uncharacterized protein YjcR
MNHDERIQQLQQKLEEARQQERIWHDHCVGYDAQIRLLNSLKAEQEAEKPDS